MAPAPCRSRSGWHGVGREFWRRVIEAIERLTRGG
jgi:hypothetical protein